MSSITPKELLEVRQYVYSFLSTVFRCPPKVEQIETILQEGLFLDFPLELEDDNYIQALKTLENWAKEQSEADIKDVFTSLNRDYTQLFIGPGHLPAPPWESVYRTEEKLTFGEHTLAVREWYARYGLEFVHKNAEPDDHFGLELEFFAYLINNEYQALEDGEAQKATELAQEQLAFLEKHLLQWSKDFTQDVITNAQTKYYQGLAQLAQSFLEWDHSNLKEENDN
ncbi:MAG: dehydrogenase [Desulfitobacterium sp.]|nr:dehydrogenase [Desulfitobacterium sp.]